MPAGAIVLLLGKAVDRPKAPAIAGTFALEAMVGHGKRMAEA